MSWQRIFDAVRKYGMPVVIADRPEEPLVLLTLDAYEALAHRKTPKPASRPVHIPVRHERGEEAVPLPPEPPISVMEMISEPVPNELNEVEREPVRSEKSIQAALELEEQFYLEPVDDLGQD